MNNSKLLKKLNNIRKERIKLNEKQDKIMVYGTRKQRDQIAKKQAELQIKWFKIANKCYYQILIKGSQKYSFYNYVNYRGCKNPKSAAGIAISRRESVIDDTIIYTSCNCSILSCPLLSGTLL